MNLQALPPKIELEDEPGNRREQPRTDIAPLLPEYSARPAAQARCDSVAERGAGPYPLRFFTRSSAEDLADGTKLKLVVRVGSRPPTGSVGWIADFLSMGLLRDLFSVRYVLAARRQAV